MDCEERHRKGGQLGEVGRANGNRVAIEGAVRLLFNIRNIKKWNKKQKASLQLLQQLNGISALAFFPNHTQPRETPPRNGVNVLGANIVACV